MATERAGYVLYRALVVCCFSTSMKLAALGAWPMVTSWPNSISTSRLRLAGPTCLTDTPMWHIHRNIILVCTSNAVNREYFVSKIFHAIIFRVKSFSDKRPCTALSLILRVYFVRLIFAQAMLSENILTSKYSQFMVVIMLY